MGVRPQFLPTKTMTIGGKVLGQKRAGGRAIAIPTGYDIGSEATTGFPVLAVLFLGSWKSPENIFT